MVTCGFPMKSTGLSNIIGDIDYMGGQVKDSIGTRYITFGNLKRAAYESLNPTDESFHPYNMTFWKRETFDCGLIIFTYD